MTLPRYVLRRLVVLVPTLFFVSVLIFSLQQLLPGDPAVALAGEEHDPVAVAAIRQKYHLDRPVPIQYGIWIGRVLRGDFGESMRNKIPVSQLIAAKLPVTVELAVCSMAIALVIGIPTGIIAAVRQGKPIAVAANVLALSGLSVPHFWLGIMLILLFAVHLGWLLSGAVLTEQIFAIPGFGKMLVDGVFNRDYAVVQGVVLVSAGLYVLLNLAGDVLCFLVNPRLRGSA